MWKYVQRTGELFGADGKLLYQGYSGHGNGKNDPSDESVRSIGPIPAGAWDIVGPPTDTPSHGPYILRLLPKPGTETFGRSGFLMHGDSIKTPGEASLGCIIMPRRVREAVWDSGDRNLAVVDDNDKGEDT